MEKQPTSHGQGGPIFSLSLYSSHLEDQLLRQPPVESIKLASLVEKPHVNN